MHAAGGTASAGAKRLKRIAEQTARLIEELGACGDYSPRGEAAALCLAREANTHGERIGGYPGFPPREFVAVSTEEAPIVRRLALYYRGEEKVQEIIGGLSLLRDLAEAAYRYERAKVEKGKTDTKRHRGDPAMCELFCELDCAWRYAFGDVPGASIPHGGGPAGGPYVRFVSTLLETYREKIPTKIDIYTPGLRDVLKLTPDAIRARIRTARGWHNMAKSNLKKT